MPVKSCPRHSDQETMVPCLGCGRDFCRICDPPKGAGQYCPVCYSESLSRLSQKRGGGTEPSLKSGILQGREKVKRKITAGRTRELKGKGARRKDTSTLKPKGIVEKLKAANLRVVAFSDRLNVTLKERFPIFLSEKQPLEDLPPLKKTWYRLAAATLIGTALWTLLVALTHHRFLIYSLLVAVLVSVGVVWAMGARYGLPIAVLAMSLAVFSLILGELFVQLLYRVQVIDKLDIMGAQSSSVVSKGVFYRGYFYDLIVGRILPAAALAFLVAWWPFPKRLAWKGFRPQKSEEALS